MPSIEENDKEVFKEKNMHSLFAKFLSANGLYPKTISASKSTQSSKGDYEWIHPDMVSLEISSPKFPSRHQVVIDIEKISTPQIKITSYELKQDLKLSDLKQKYFQAVSNSSWAHRGYLVVFNIEESKEMENELSRLIKSFGIGVYVFNPRFFTGEKIDNKNLFVLYKDFNCNEKNELELEFIEKLSEVNNSDFKQFLAACTSLIGCSEFAFDSIINQNFDKCETFEQDISLAKKFKQDSFINYIEKKEERVSSTRLFDWINEDWKNKKFEKLIYKDTEFNCSNAVDVYMTFCSVIYSENSDIFVLYNNEIKNNSNNNKKRVDFSLTENELFQPRRIPDSSLFADINISNSQKQKRILRLISLGEMNENDFQIFLSQ